MRMQPEDVKPGTWVRMPALHPGMWKVSKAIRGFMEDRWSLDEPSRKSTRTLVFSYRVVNDLWKRSFSVCSCEASFVQALSADDGKRLEASVLSDAKLMKDWERYQAKTKLPDLIANLPFGELKEIEGFSKLCDEMLANRIDSGVTVDEVLS